MNYTFEELKSFLVSNLDRNPVIINCFIETCAYFCLYNKVIEISQVQELLDIAVANKRASCIKGNWLFRSPYTSKLFLSKKVVEVKNLKIEYVSNSVKTLLGFQEILDLWNTMDVLSKLDTYKN